MSPNINSCDPRWTRKMINDQEDVVVVAWSDALNMNKLTENLGKLEEQGTPVMVVDCDSCQQIPEDLGLKPGEIAVYKKGVEAGRVEASEDIEGDVNKVKQVVSRQ